MRSPSLAKGSAWTDVVSALIVHTPVTRPCGRLCYRRKLKGAVALARFLAAVRIKDMINRVRAKSLQSEEPSRADDHEREEEPHQEIVGVVRRWEQGAAWHADRAKEWNDHEPGGEDRHDDRTFG